MAKLNPRVGRSQYYGTRGDFKTQFDKLTRFDLVRISKLLEMTQVAIVVSIFCFGFGILADVILPPPDESRSTFAIVVETWFQMAMVVLAVYYARKVAFLVPFIFRLTDSYIPSRHGEAAVGVAAATSLVMYSSQVRLRERLNIIRKRVFPRSM